MKILILFYCLIVATSSFSMFMKIDDIGVCGKVKYAKNCGNNCIEISKRYNCKYSKKADEMKDDVSAPIWASRSMIDSCLGIMDCKEQALVKECINGRSPYYNAEYSEIWCGKITGYNQIPSGKKIVIEDQPLKAAYIAQVQAEKDLKQSKKDAVKALKAKVELDQDLTPAELRVVLKYLIKD